MTERGRTFLTLDHYETLMVELVLSEAISDLDRLVVGKTDEQKASVQPWRKSVVTLRDRLKKRIAHARSAGAV